MITSHFGSGPLKKDIIAAIPLLSAGTDPIIELVFGEKNKPEPNPIISMYTISKVFDVLDVIVISPNNPTAETRSPMELNTLDPYLSERCPLTGEIITIEIAKGVKYIPAVIWSIDFIP